MRVIPENLAVLYGTSTFAQSTVIEKGGPESGRKKGGGFKSHSKESLENLVKKQNFDERHLENLTHDELNHLHDFANSNLFNRGLSKETSKRVKDWHHGAAVESRSRQQLEKGEETPILEKGGKPANVGETRNWNGKNYKKQPNGKWLEVSDKGLSRKEHESEALKDNLKVSSHSSQTKINQHTTSADIHTGKALGLSHKEYSDEEVGLGGGDSYKGKTTKEIKDSMKTKISGFSDKELIDRYNNHNSSEILDHELHMLANDEFEREIENRNLSKK